MLVTGCSVAFFNLHPWQMVCPLPWHTPVTMERRTPVRLFGRVSPFMPHGVRRSKAAVVRRSGRCLWLGARWLPSICTHRVWFALCHGILQCGFLGGCRRSCRTECGAPRRRGFGVALGYYEWVSGGLLHSVPMADGLPSAMACSIEHGAPHSSAAFLEGVAAHAARSAALQGNDCLGCYWDRWMVRRMAVSSTGAARQHM